MTTNFAEAVRRPRARSSAAIRTAAGITVQHASQTTAVAYGVYGATPAVNGNASAPATKTTNGTAIARLGQTQPTAAPHSTAARVASRRLDTGIAHARSGGRHVTASTATPSSRGSGGARNVGALAIESVAPVLDAAGIVTVRSEKSGVAAVVETTTPSTARSTEGSGTPSGRAPFSRTTQVHGAFRLSDPRTTSPRAFVHANVVAPSTSGFQNPASSGECSWSMSSTNVLRDPKSAT